MRRHLRLNRDIFHQVSWGKDFIAGLTVAVVVVPQGLAYAILAGLPAIYGLYAAFVPLLIYPILGSSRHLSVGPVALVSILMLSGLSQFASPGSEQFIHLALLTAMLAGVIQVLLAFLRLGFLVKFLSLPVMNGFTTAAAIIIIFNQLKTLLGFNIGGSSDLLSQVGRMINNMDSLHLLTATIGITGLVVLLFFKKMYSKFPAGIVIVILSILVLYFTQWNERGVAIVGAVPGGLPALNLPSISWNEFSKVIPLSFVICLVSFIESLAIAKNIADKKDGYAIDANQELFGLGFAKIIGAFFQAYPNTGSFSRSAINFEAGGKSGVSSLFAALIVGLILLFFTPLFYFLPKPILAAIVISAVIGIINLPYARQLFKIDKKDFYVYLTTFIATLLLGIQSGIFSGIILSLILIIHKSSTPHYAILGKLPGRQSFRNILRYPNAILCDKILIMRYDQDLYFGNIDHFIESINQELLTYPNTERIILNAGGIGHLDSTALGQVKKLFNRLEKNNISIALTHLRGPVRDLLNQQGLLDAFGIENIFLTTLEALHYDEELGEDETINDYAVQTTQVFNKNEKS